MKKPADSKERIVKAAIEEFSKNGFYGARVESIAEKARINKAMIFYYFSSKEHLYKKVITFIAKHINENIMNSGIADGNLTPEDYIEKFPEIYLRFFHKNPDYLRVIGLGLIQNSKFMKSLLSEIFSEFEGGLPVKFASSIREWSREGKITEGHPAHFFLNIVSLTLFPLLSKPLSEAIFGESFNDSTFVEERLKSINTLLKKGMIT